MAIPPFSNAPGTLNNIPSMGTVLRLQGWSVISSCPGNMGAAGSNTASNLYANAMNGLTYQADEFSPVSVPYVMTVYANWGSNAAPNYFLPAANDQYVKNTYLNPTTTELVTASFSGERLGKVASRTLRFTDPVSFPVTLNTKYNPRTHWRACSYAQLILSNATTTAGSTGPQPNGTDGALNEDQTEIGAATSFHNGSFSVGNYVGILGYTGTNPAKSLGLSGDSIFAGTGDGGGHETIACGWGRRIAWGGQALNTVNMQWPLSTVAFGHVIEGRGAGTLAAWATGVGQNAGPYELVDLATTFLSNLGTNDLGTSLATNKANYLLVATRAAKQGQFVIFSTLLPRTTSTDGWLTTVNQTRVSVATIDGINSWLRDASATGFVQQAAAASGYPSSNFYVFDAAAAIEVNSSGVPTVGGGYWRPPQTAAVYTGSVTGGAGGKNSFLDSAFTATLNQYRGYAIVWLTGGNAGVSNTVISNQQTTGGTIALIGTTNNITVGDTYAVYLDIGTIDGTHPTSWSHMTVAAAFPPSVVQ